MKKKIADLMDFLAKNTHTPRPTDICECGDYRKHHEPLGGKCRICDPGGPSAHIPELMCHKFKFSSRG